MLDFNAEDCSAGPGGIRAAKVSLRATELGLLAIAVVMFAVALIVLAWRTG